MSLAGETFQFNTDQSDSDEVSQTELFHGLFLAAYVAKLPGLFARA